MPTRRTNGCLGDRGKANNTRVLRAVSIRWEKIETSARVQEELLEVINLHGMRSLWGERWGHGGMFRAVTTENGAG